MWNHYTEGFSIFFHERDFFLWIFSRILMANLRMEEALRVSDIRCKRDGQKVRILSWKKSNFSSNAYSEIVIWKELFYLLSYTSI